MASSPSKSSSFLSLLPELQQLILHELLNPLTCSSEDRLNPIPDLFFQIHDLVLVSRSFAVLTLPLLRTSLPGQPACLPALQEMVSRQETVLNECLDHRERILRHYVWTEGNGFSKEYEKEYMKLIALAEQLKGSLRQKVLRMRGWVKAVERWAELVRAGAIER